MVVPRSFDLESGIRVRCGCQGLGALEVDAQLVVDVILSKGKDGNQIGSGAAPVQRQLLTPLRR